MATTRTWHATAALILLAACSPTADRPGNTERGCADVIAVEARQDSNGSWSFDTTVRSQDTGWDKYADLWVVRAMDGTVLGERELLYPHENEQPFTRSLAGVEIPPDVDTVEVAARDSVERCAYRADACGRPRMDGGYYRISASFRPALHPPRPGPASARD